MSGDNSASQGSKSSSPRSNSEEEDRHAYVSQAVPQESSSEDEGDTESGEDYHPNDANMHYVSSERQAAQLEAMDHYAVAYVATTSRDDADAIDEYPAECAHCCQAETLALIAYKGKGKSKGRVNGSKKPGNKSPVRRNGLSLEERKRKLKVIKKKTKYSLCGEKGHWAGDPECSKTQKLERRPSSSSRPPGKRDKHRHKGKSSSSS